MKITTIITLSLIAFLLAGCILQTGKEGVNAASALETNSQPAIKNETTMKNESANAPNSGAAPANESAPPMKNKTAQPLGTTPASYSGNETAPVGQPLERQPLQKTEENPSRIKIAYFYSNICQFSPNATIYMDWIEKNYPVSIMRYEIYYNLTNFNLLKEYAAEYGLKDEEFAVPIAFINTSHYGGPNIYEGLEPKIKNLAKETKK